MKYLSVILITSLIFLALPSHSFADSYDIQWTTDVAPYMPGQLLVLEDGHIFAKVLNSPGFLVLDQDGTFLKHQDFNGNDEQLHYIFSPYEDNPAIVISIRPFHVYLTGEAKSYFYDVDSLELMPDEITIGHLIYDYCYRDQYIICTDGGEDYFPKAYGRDLVVIDRTSNQCFSIYEFPAEPSSISISLVDYRCYVLVSSEREIYVFDTTSNDPYDWANNVEVLDLSFITADGPLSFDLDYSNHHLYLRCGMEHEIYKVNANNGLYESSIAIGRPVQYIRCNSDLTGLYIYVYSSENNENHSLLFYETATGILTDYDQPGKTLRYITNAKEMEYIVGLFHTMYLEDYYLVLLDTNNNMFTTDAETGYFFIKAWIDGYGKLVMSNPEEFKIQMVQM